MKPTMSNMLSNISNSIENRLRLVLDTNVCLDLFVFHDTRWESILIGLREKKFEAITNTGCRDEWMAVLQYKQLPITEATRPDIVRAYDEMVSCMNPDVSPHIKLPRCSDPDDQQFMELARDAQATHLITKDKALLKCARKVAQGGLFQILSPEMFIKSVEIS